jgi:CO dehydrogenase maturation factor
MKLAILGKGGSGKSSVSWLIANYLSQDKQYHTLAIDSDHNMDLTSCLGIKADSSKYFKDFNAKFRQISKMPELGMWKEYFKQEPVAFIYPNDPRLEKYITKVNPKLELLLAGLGDEELMLSNKCSHALSAPIKYMMPTMQLAQNSWIVLDSVAGSDMLNYGLYFGFDCLCAVVEGHINSIKVAKQLKVLTDRQGLKLYFILNKYSPDNTLTQEFETENADLILGKIPIDLAIVQYNYTLIKQNTKGSLELMIEKIRKQPKVQNAYDNLKNFELAKV